MITIYSTDGEKLFTDPKRRAYIDADLLTDRAYYTRQRYLLDQIAVVLGFDSFDSLRTSMVAQGVTDTVLMNWILSGRIAEFITRIPVQ